MCQMVDSEKSTKRNSTYICPRVGLALQLSTQAKTIGSKAQSTAEKMLDSNTEHTECAVVMDQKPTSQANDRPILDTPCREITSVPA